MAAQALVRVLSLARNDAQFRRSALADLGLALAEEGIVLTDADMAELRTFWETVRTLDERLAYERIASAVQMLMRAT